MILDILNELAATDSINKKKAIVAREKDNELLKRVFLLAYSKRFNYGIKKWPQKVNRLGFTLLPDALDFLETKLATRVLSGNAAIDALAGIIDDLSHGQPGEEEVLRRVMMRDLECGTGQTIANQIWKNLIPQQPQMLASSYDEKQIAKHIKFPAYAQLKADGARAFAEITDDGVTFFSRAGNEYKGLNKLAADLMDATVELRKQHPAGIMIDGELVYHEPKKEPQGLDFLFEETPETSNDTELAIVDRSTSNGFANKALKGTLTSEEALGMKFQVWDLVPLDEVYSEGKVKGLKYDARFYLLTEIVKGYDTMILIENHVVRNLKEAGVIYKKYVDEGLEGIILKNMDSYWENKRSKNMYKFKEVIDIALEVIDYYAHSKDPNKIGGVTLKSSCGRIVTDCGSGFTDTTRKKIDGVWVDIPITERHELDREFLMKEARKGKLIGRIADMECNGWTTSKGRKDDTLSLFLPIIKGFRFDKTKADSFEEVFGQV
ncbi:DNA ligase [Serratia phage 4S]|nr:DNA ligase [Serratia phage 4S]